MATFNARRDLMLILLRLVVGFGFAAHGYAKLARGPEHFAEILVSLHVPAPHLMAWLTTVVELVGGIGVMAGAFVSLLAIPLTIVLVTAMLTVHLQYGFSSVRLLSVSDSGATFGPVGYELDLLYLAALLAVASVGPGNASVDAWRAARRLQSSLGRRAS
ncbi:MAG: DoxX family protein [Gemmatimonadota bacterium]